MRLEISRIVRVGSFAMYFVLVLVLVQVGRECDLASKKQKAMEVRRLKSIRYVFRLEYGTSTTCIDLFARKNVQQQSEDDWREVCFQTTTAGHELTTVYL